MLRTYEDFEREAKEYQNILLRYKKKGEVFTDPNFHPTAKIEEISVKFDDKSFVWKRIDDYFKAPLFKPELISPNFIQQGELGDCYFLSALSRIARQPDLVESLFEIDQPSFYLGEVENSINLKCGAVVIYFHAFGRQTPVLIDTLIPFKRGTRSPRFSHPSDLTASPWFCLVEKAFAKLNGSFAGIISGQFPSAIYSLFGYYPDNKLVNDLKDPKKMVKMTPFERIMKYQHEGSVMDAGIHTQYYKTEITEDALLDLGLVTKHSYLIMKARTEEGKNFLCLRNPWGDHEWLGDWSDTSECWTEHLKEALGMQEADDGIFWMIEDDFFYYFTSIDIARPIPDDRHSRIFSVELKPGPHDGHPADTKEANVANRPNFAIQITEPIRPDEKCKVYFIIERRHPIIDTKTKTRIDATKIQVVFLETKGKKLSPEVYSRSGGQIMTTSNDLIGLKRVINSNSDIYTIFINRLEKVNYTEACYVQVICKYDFKLYNIDNPTELMPETQSGGIQLDNYSVMHPDVAPQLIKVKVRGRVVSRFDKDKKSPPPPPKKTKRKKEVTQEDLEKAESKLQKEKKAKQKAEEEAKSAQDEIARLQQKMKEMENEIAEKERKLQEEKAKAKADIEKQRELERQLELEKSLLVTRKEDYKAKKRDADKLKLKAKKKKAEADEATSLNSFIHDSLHSVKKDDKDMKEKEDKKKIISTPEVSNPPELFEIVEVDSDEPKPKPKIKKTKTTDDDDDTKKKDKSDKDEKPAKEEHPDKDDKPKRKSKKKFIPKVRPC